MRDIIDGEERTVKPKSFWQNPKYDTGSGGRELASMLGDKDAFSSPKPVELVKDIVKISANKDGIILDFFAGSGTTLQAVAELNAEDGGSRQCILITDEGKNSDDPAAVNIADDVTYVRCYRVLTGKDWADGKSHPDLNQSLDAYAVELVPTREKEIVDYDDSGSPVYSDVVESISEYDLQQHLLDISTELKNPDEVAALMKTWRRVRNDYVSYLVSEKEARLEGSEQQENHSENLSQEETIPENSEQKEASSESLKQEEEDKS